MVCSFVEGFPYAKRLNEQGYSAFVLYYRYRKNVRHPAPMDDLVRVLWDILSRAEELNLDTDRYSIWVSSAEGHLVASFGTEAMGHANYHLPKPSALVLCYPMITMGEKTHPGSRDNLLSKTPDAAMLDFTSVEKQVTPAYPSTFVWCSNADRTVDPENSRMLAGGLEKNGISHRFVEYHGVGLGEWLACEGWFEKTITFWKGRLSDQQGGK